MIYDLLIGVRTKEYRFNPGMIIFKDGRFFHPKSVRGLKRINESYVDSNVYGYSINSTTIVKLTRSYLEYDWNSAFIRCGCDTLSLLGKKINGYLPSDEELLYLRSLIFSNGRMRADLEEADILDICNYRSSKFDVDDGWGFVWSSSSECSRDRNGKFRRLSARVDFLGKSIYKETLNQFYIIPFFKLI